MPSKPALTPFMPTNQYLSSLEYGSISTYLNSMRYFTTSMPFACWDQQMGTTQNPQNGCILNLRRKLIGLPTNVTTWNRWQCGFNVERPCGFGKGISPG